MLEGRDRDLFRIRTILSNSYRNRVDQINSACLVFAPIHIAKYLRKVLTTP